MEDLSSNPALADATDAERRRFLTARKQDVGAATTMLQRYLAWRRSTLPLAEGEPRLGEELLPWMRFHGRARDQTRIVHMQGAMYDPTAATPQQWAHATAQEFDSNICRDSMEKVSLLVDVRGDEAWPNRPGRQFVPVVRAVSKVLGDNFPERLHRLVVYPVPWAGVAVWKACQPFVDTTTAQKVVLIHGPSKRGAPCPPELGEYVDYDQISEDRRHRHVSLLAANAENVAPTNGA